MTRKPHPALSSVAAAAAALFAVSAQAAQVSWIAAANGFWDVAANWSSGLPGAADDALIDVAGARVITLRATGGPFAVNSLVVGGDDALAITSGGSLTLGGLPTAFNPSGASLIAALTQSGGTLAGAGLVTVTGAASLGGNGLHSGAGSTVLRGASTLGGFNLDAGRTLRNEGTATVTGAMNLNATNAAGAGNIVNAAGAVFDVRTFNLSIGAGSFTGDTGSDALIRNAGIFRKSSAGTYGVDVRFENQAGGTIDVQVGGFNFTGGGSHAGTVTLATGTALTWTGDTHEIAAGAAFGGDGTLQLAGGVTVELKAPTTIASRFTQGPGTLRGADLTLTGAATALNNGTHSGSGSTTVQGPSTWSGFALDAGRVLRNEGTATVTGGLNLNASDAAGAGRIENRAGAVIDVRTFNLSIAAGSFAGDTGADAAIVNAGTFRKSTAGGYGVAVPFTNLAGGVIDVQAGSFNFTAGGSHGGTATLASGAVLGFGGGTHAIAAGARFEGAGTLSLTGAGTVLDVLAPATVDSAFSMGGGTLRGADLTLTGPVTLAISSSLGVMAGAATTTTTGTSTVGGGANNPFGLDAGRVLRNTGTMSITGVINLNRLDTPGAGRIENAAGALIDVVTFNQSIVASAFAGDGGADAAVVNAGIFRKSTAGTYGVGVAFVNQPGGLIDVQAGGFDFSGGSSHRGDVALAADTALSFSGGTHQVAAGARFTGAGTLALAGAATVLDLLAATRIDSGFTMTGGTVQGAPLVLAGPYALTISSSLGVLRGPTTTTLLGDGTVSGGPNNPFGLDAGQVLRNQGTMVITGVLDLNRLSETGSGRIDNAAGALIDVRTFNQSIFARDWRATNALDGGGDARVDNAGTFRKSSSGTYSVLVPFFNTGTVEVLAGGFNIPTFANGGRLDVAAGATFQVSSAGFVNTGLIQGNGRVIAPGSGVVNSGLIGPGHSPGHLTIEGDLRMAAGGAVEIELNGPADFDLLTVTGDVTLAGALRIVRLAGYAPAVGDSFVVMTFDDRGATTFGSVAFLGFGDGVQLGVTYRDHDVLVGVTAVPAPAAGWMLLSGLGVLALRSRRGFSRRSCRPARR